MLAAPLGRARPDLNGEHAALTSSARQPVGRIAHMRMACVELYDSSSAAAAAKARRAALVEAIKLGAGTMETELE